MRRMKRDIHGHPEKTGGIAMEARLGTSSETLLRYERACEGGLVSRHRNSKESPTPGSSSSPGKYETNPLTAYLSMGSAVPASEVEKAPVARSQA